MPWRLLILAETVIPQHMVPVEVRKLTLGRLPWIWNIKGMCDKCRSSQRCKYKLRLDKQQLKLIPISEPFCMYVYWNLATPLQSNAQQSEEGVLPKNNWTNKSEGFEHLRSILRFVTLRFDSILGIQNMKLSWYVFHTLTARFNASRALKFISVVAKILPKLFLYNRFLRHWRHLPNHPYTSSHD